MNGTGVRQLMIGGIARRIEPSQAHVENFDDPLIVEQQVSWLMSRCTTPLLWA